MSVPKQPLTLGIEEEYQIIDPATRDLRTYISELLTQDQARAKRLDVQGWSTLSEEKAKDNPDAVRKLMTMKSVLTLTPHPTFVAPAYINIPGAAAVEDRTPDTAARRN